MRNVAWWLAAVVAYIVVLGGAAETVIAGVPLRWIVVAVVAAYFATSIVLWRRTSAEVKTLLSVLVLLALFVVFVQAALTSPSPVAAALPSPGASASSDAAASPGAATVAPASVTPQLITVGNGQIVSSVRSAAGRLGSDPGKSLAWVSSKIAFEAYPGALRGAAGTLLAGSGNSLDQSLLLHDLIIASNHAATLRFASCTLPTDQAQQLVDLAAANHGPRRKLVYEVADRLVAQARDAQAKATLRQAATTWHTMTSDDRSETSELAKALAVANVTPSATSNVKDQLHGFAVHHVWLQVLRAGTWVDLDPTLPGATPGRNRCGAAIITDALPADQYDQLTVSVRIEDRQGGTLASSVLLDKSFRIADLAGTNLTFAYAEPMSIADVSSSLSAAPAGFRPYTPVLRVGDTNVAGQPMFLPIPASAAATNLSSPVTNGLDKVNSSFGGTAAPAVATAAPPQSSIDGSWLDLTVATADGWHETFETPIFDRIGYAVRAAGGAPAAQLAPLPEAQGEYAPLDAMWSVAVWAGAVPAGAHRQSVASSGSDAAVLADGLAGLHSAYGLLQRALFESAETSAASRVALMRPGLSLLSVGLTQDNGGTPRSRMLIDVLSDHSRVVLGSASANLGESAVRRGVSSALAERLLVRNGTPGHDVIAAFDAARSGNVPLEALHPSDKGNVTGLAVSPDARAYIGAVLAGGDTVLVPTRPAAGSAESGFGWWIVDPNEGSVRDEMENGRHPEVEEESGLLNFARRNAKVLKCLALVVSFAVDVSAAEVGAEGGFEGAESAADAMNSFREANEIEEKIKGSTGC
jgi:hypothetical protein